MVSIKGLIITFYIKKNVTANLFPAQFICVEAIKNGLVRGKTGCAISTGGRDGSVPDVCGPMVE